LARLLHLASPAARKAFFLLYTPTDGCPPARMWATLAEGGGTLILDGLERWPLESQAALAHHFAAHRRTAVRLIVISRRSESRLRLEGQLDPALVSLWAGRVIDVPPLRARPDDLEPLVGVMLHRARRPTVVLDPASWRALATHGWTDNVRELRKVLEAALVHAAGNRIEPHHLVLDPLAPPSLEALAERSFVTMRREVDGWYLRRLLDQTGDNLSEASRRSGCSRKVLRDRLRRLGLYRGEPAYAEPASSDAHPLGDAIDRGGHPGTMAAEERVVKWSILVKRRDRAQGRSPVEVHVGQAGGQLAGLAAEAAAGQDRHASVGEQPLAQRGAAVDAPSGEGRGVGGEVGEQVERPGGLAAA
jgi:hypothetical protein